MERLPRLLGNKSYLPSGRIVLARRWARHINVNDCVSAEPEKLIIGLPRRPSFCQESLFQFKEPGGGWARGQEARLNWADIDGQRYVVSRISKIMNI